MGRTALWFMCAVTAIVAHLSPLIQSAVLPENKDTNITAVVNTSVVGVSNKKEVFVKENETVREDETTSKLPSDSASENKKQNEDKNDESLVLLNDDPVAVMSPYVAKSLPHDYLKRAEFMHERPPPYDHDPSERRHGGHGGHSDDGDERYGSFNGLDEEYGGYPHDEDYGGYPHEEDEHAYHDYEPAYGSRNKKTHSRKRSRFGPEEIDEIEYERHHVNRHQYDNDNTGERHVIESSRPHSRPGPSRGKTSQILRAPSLGDRRRGYHEKSHPEGPSYFPSKNRKSTGSCPPIDDDFCDGMYAGHFAHPTTGKCFIQCSEAGQSFSMECAPGTKWKGYPSHKPAAFNMCM